ncbi:MAG: DUF3300 domain-containing protein [Candidimonas sp.]|nr:MAG: DUF3300 domain-containing protein [Candidimonas sp.]TAM22652.1 MAG: DUF3300 domain-containing protein [Candidimonas sp.]TAM74616.1 MAG: DUF3300 domain-containing protein [Candidimonas sp.]
MRYFALFRGRELNRDHIVLSARVEVPCLARLVLASKNMNLYCQKAVGTAKQMWMLAGWRKLVSATSACACLLVAFAFAAVSAQAAPVLSPPQLEQLVAPVALYPDSLLSQVLMASTYPLEVVDAARWRGSQPKAMSDSQLSAAMYNEPWDPSVKSLAAFPNVLQMMSDKIDWTQQLGDAFLGQQPDVMDAVQRLRARARAAGNLRTSPQQTVLVSNEGSPIIQIVPVQPDVVYVPIYNPLVVFGPWMYPVYRPFYWHPPTYYPAPGVFFSFGAGLVVGPALWGHVDWHRHDVSINVTRYNTFNNTHITNNRWVYNVNHRRGVDYRGPAAAGRFQRSSAARSAAREQYRGAANMQRQQLADPAHRQAAERAVSREQGRNQIGSNTALRDSQQRSAAVRKQPFNEHTQVRQQRPVSQPRPALRQLSTERPQAPQHRQAAKRHASVERPLGGKKEHRREAPDH